MMGSMGLGGDSASENAGVLGAAAAFGLGDKFKEL